MRRLSWIVVVTPISNHKCHYKREAEGYFMHTEEEEAMRPWRQRMERKHLRLGYLGHTSGHQKIEASGNRLSPPQPLEETWPCQHLDFEMTFANIWPPEL